MNLCSGIIYEALSALGNVKCAGRPIDALCLAPPVFYTEGTAYEDDGIYIGSGTMPAPPANVRCLVIRARGELPEDVRRGKSCVMALPDADIAPVFNAVQNAFREYGEWDRRLQEIMETTADLQEMITITAAVLHKSISAVDNRLNYMYGSEQIYDLPVREVGEWSAIHQENTAHREPFLYEYHDTVSYCVNLYVGDFYRGILAMAPAAPEDERTTMVLFRHFASLFLKAMQITRNSDILPPGMRSIFRDVLNGQPVNGALLRREMERFPVLKWRCLAIEPCGGMAQLPLEYFCRQLENLFAAACAMIFEEKIVLFLPVRANQNTRSLPLLKDELKDFEIRCGISHFFTEAEDAGVYYRQARIALDLSARLRSGEKLAYFKDYALPYALLNSVGALYAQDLNPQRARTFGARLSPRDFWPEGLKKIKSGVPREDSWKTLRTYLDLEMNAAQTARVLYTHRTTLQAHLKKIEELVDLSTPEKRMYIRWCMYLDEVFEKI